MKMERLKQFLFRFDLSSAVVPRCGTCRQSWTVLRDDDMMRAIWARVCIPFKTCHRESDTLTWEMYDVEDKVQNKEYILKYLFFYY